MHFLTSFELAQFYKPHFPRVMGHLEDRVNRALSKTGSDLIVNECPQTVPSTPHSPPKSSAKKHALTTLNCNINFNHHKNHTSALT
jgi:hypothetical protein